MFPIVQAQVLQLAEAGAPSAAPVPIPLDQQTLAQAFPYVCNVEGCKEKTRDYVVRSEDDSNKILRHFGRYQNTTPRFRKHKQLTAHLKIHNTNSWYCKLCDKYSAQIGHKDANRVSCSRWDTKWSANPTKDDKAELMETNPNFSELDTSDRPRLVIKVKVPRTC